MRFPCAPLPKLIARRSATYLEPIRKLRTPHPQPLSPKGRGAYPDRLLAFVVALIWQFAIWHSIARADKPAPAADLAVDQVSLKGGPRLLGSGLGHEADGTLAFAVGREWLKKANLKFFENALAEETAESRAAFVELRDRIVEWIRDRAPENDFDFFLKKESERVEQAIKDIDAGTYLEKAPFIVLDLTPAKIERVVIQPPPRKRIALTAWRESLADVETRSTGSLTQELKKLKVTPVEDDDFLLDLLPPRRQNESAWAARKAIVEYQFLKPLDFQGRGDLVLKAGQQLNAANAGKLFGDLVNSFAGDPFSDLLGPGAEPGAGNTGKKKTTGRPQAEGWLDAAAKIAEADKIAGFRVTRSQEDLTAKQVTVETRFVARMPDGSWKTVWQRTESADAAKVRADVEQQIMQDPQIRSALELVKSIGIGGDEQIKMAIRFGAATQEAQKQADSRFFEFRDRCLHRLDGPVLRIAPAPAAKATN